MRPLPEQSFGLYRLEEALATGPRSTLYRARERAARAGSQSIALKIFPPVARDEVARAQLARFFRDLETASRLSHPGLVRIFDYGVLEDRPFIAMELCDGPILAPLLRRSERPPFEEAARLVAEVARALDLAHARDLFHRNLKPSNLIFHEGRIRLTDFGVIHLEEARALEAEMAGDALRYRAPEQLLGRPVDGRADQFSLGILFYQLITGVYPFPGRRGLSAQTGRERPSPPRWWNPSLLPDIDPVCARVLSREPQERYPSCLAFAHALENILSRRTRSGQFVPPLEPPADRGLEASLEVPASAWPASSNRIGSVHGPSRPYASSPAHTLPLETLISAEAGGAVQGILVEDPDDAWLETSGAGGQTAEREPQGGGQEEQANGPRTAGSNGDPDEHADEGVILAVGDPDEHADEGVILAVSDPDEHADEGVIFAGDESARQKGGSSEYDRPDEKAIFGAPDEEVGLESPEAPATAFPFRAPGATQPDEQPSRWGGARAASPGPGQPTPPRFRAPGAFLPDPGPAPGARPVGQPSGPGASFQAPGAYSPEPTGPASVTSPFQVSGAFSPAPPEKADSSANAFIDPDMLAPGEDPELAALIAANQRGAAPLPLGMGGTGVGPGGADAPAPTSMVRRVVYLMASVAIALAVLHFFGPDATLNKPGGGAASDRPARLEETRSSALPGEGGAGYGLTGEGVPGQPTGDAIGQGADEAGALRSGGEGAATAIEGATWSAGSAPGDPLLNPEVSLPGRAGSPPMPPAPGDALLDGAENPDGSRQGSLIPPPPTDSGVLRAPGDPLVEAKPNAAPRTDVGKGAAGAIHAMGVSTREAQQIDAGVLEGGRGTASATRASGQDPGGTPRASRQ